MMRAAIFVITVAVDTSVFARQIVFFYAIVFTYSYINAWSNSNQIISLIESAAPFRIEAETPRLGGRSEQE